MRYEFDPKRMNLTYMSSDIEMVYDGIDSIAIFGSSSEYCQECTFEGLKFSDSEPLKVDDVCVERIKNKTLEVLERDFALKYPGPYKIFKEEQDKLLLEFIENHEESV